MPCSDVTEVIDLELDAAECLRAYSLVKRTCGAEIGSAALLADWVRGKNAKEIGELGATEMLARYAPPHAEEFLYSKHLAALKAALSVLTGESRGAPGDACTVATVEVDGDSLRFQGHIAVDLLTHEIRSCGGCGSCGSR